MTRIERSSYSIEGGYRSRDPSGAGLRPGQAVLRDDPRRAGLRAAPRLARSAPRVVRHRGLAQLLVAEGVRNGRQPRDLSRGRVSRRSRDFTRRPWASETSSTWEPGVRPESAATTTPPACTTPTAIRSRLSTGVTSPRAPWRRSLPPGVAPQIALCRRRGIWRILRQSQQRGVRMKLRVFALLAVLVAALAVAGSAFAFDCIRVSSSLQGLKQSTRSGNWLLFDLSSGPAVQETLANLGETVDADTAKCVSDTYLKSRPDAVLRTRRRRCRAERRSRRAQQEHQRALERQRDRSPRGEPDRRGALWGGRRVRPRRRRIAGGSLRRGGACSAGSSSFLAHPRHSPVGTAS